MFDIRKDNKGVWTPTCLKKIYPSLLQKNQEKRVSQQLNHNTVKINEVLNNEISVLTNSTTEIENINKPSAPTHPNKLIVYDLSDIKRTNLNVNISKR